MDQELDDIVDKRLEKCTCGIRGECLTCQVIIEDEKIDMERHQEAMDELEEVLNRD